MHGQHHAYRLQPGFDMYNESNSDTTLAITAVNCAAIAVSEEQILYFHLCGLP